MHIWTKSIYKKTQTHARDRRIICMHHSPSFSLSLFLSGKHSLFRLEKNPHLCLESRTTLSFLSLPCIGNRARRKKSGSIFGILRFFLPRRGAWKTKQYTRRKSCVYVYIYLCASYRLCLSRIFRFSRERDMRI